MAANDSRRPAAATNRALSTYDLLIGILAVLSLIILALLIFAPLSPSTRDVLNSLEDGLCAVFLFDFFRSLRRAPRKWGYFLRGGGWLDLLGSVPFSAFALFRVFRLFRIVRVVRTLRGSDVREILMERLAQSVLLFTLVIALVLIFVIGAVVAWAEHGKPGSNIETYPEGVWWAIVTLTTVGYGDYYPVTTVGRFSAVILMFSGLGIIGVLSSYLATTFIALQSRRAARGGTVAIHGEGHGDDGQARADDHSDEVSANSASASASAAPAEATATELAAIRKELAALRHLVEEQHEPSHELP